MDTIKREELEQKMKGESDLRIIDVLPPAHFNNEHLPGAENVPLSESFEERIQEAVPDKDSEVVLYCANTDCPASEEAAEKMEALGYSNVKDYGEGIDGWKAGGKPIETS